MLLPSFNSSSLSYLILRLSDVVRVVIEHNYFYNNNELQPFGQSAACA